MAFAELVEAFRMGIWLPKTSDIERGPCLMSVAAKYERQ